MYRNCIFCSGLLGGNDVVESFPVGTQLAFDGWKGRLWAVCPRCARWNLAPIEERWEPVEQAEKVFRDARMRVQSENIGLARLPDGTRLIRVGKALPGELAAWRYGTQLLRRRNRYLLGVIGAGAVFGVWLFPLAGSLSSGAGVWLYATWWLKRPLNILYRMRGVDRGDDVIVRRWHIPGMSVRTGFVSGDVEVAIRDAHVVPMLDAPPQFDSRDIVTVSRDSARALLGRALVYVNQKGAGRNGVESATQLLTDTGSAEDYLRRATAEGFGLGDHAGFYTPIKGPSALALEMALNEESERRALEGELVALRAAWREAEEIASIADSLPDRIRLPEWLRR